MTRRAIRQQPRGRKLGFERLESRVVLDGGVQAFVRGGNLLIRGDSGDNQITIEQSSMRSFTISSRDGTTLINGGSGPETFFGVRRNLDISLANGDDIVDIVGTAADAVTVSNRLIINTGAGADQVLLTEVHAIGLHINTGSGNDTVNVGTSGAEGGLVVTKEAVIVTGSGQDDASISNSNFKRFLNLNMGNNNDTTTMQNVTVHRRSVIQGGSGTDTLNRENNHGKLKFRSFEHVNNTVTTPAPTPPVAVNDTATVVRGGSTTINVATNDTAATGQTIDVTSIAITQQPTNGTVTVNNDGTVTYTNNGTVVATSDSFQYTIQDQDGNTSNAATVAITITAPTGFTAFNDTASVTEDSTTNPISGNVLDNDANTTGATITAVNGSAANVGANVPGSFGTFSIGSNGAYTYTLDNANATVNGLNTGDTREDSVSYTGTVGTTNSTATLRVTINGHTD